MNEIIIRFDHLPNRGLSPNARNHWTTKSKLVHTARDESFGLAQEIMSGWVAPEQAVISYRFIVTDHRRRDLDNLLSSCKSWLDGLRDAGVLVDDDCWHLSIGQILVELGDKEATEIKILWRKN